jgi:hypothetical protein
MISKVGDIKTSDLFCSLKGVSQRGGRRLTGPFLAPEDSRTADTES